MGGFISTIKDNKMISLKYEGMVRKGESKEKIDTVAKKYTDYFNNHGFYKITIDTNELNSFLDKELSIIETFNNLKNKNIEGFFGKDYKKTIDSMEKNIMLLMFGSMYGLYTIASKDGSEIGKNPMKLSQIQIIISKMFIKKTTSKELIDFIFGEWNDAVFQTKSDRDKENNKMLNEIVLTLFTKISNKRKPEIAFSNIIGILIKSSVIITAFQIYDSLPSSKKKSNTTELFKLIINDVVDIVPDDKCHLKTPSMKFLKIDPELCKYDTKSEWEKDYENCNIKKIKLETSLKTCKTNLTETKKNLDETKKKLKDMTKSRDLWRIIGVVGIILFIIFLVLYIMKKCTKPVQLDDSPSEE